MWDVIAARIETQAEKLFYWLATANSFQGSAIVYGLLSRKAAFEYAYRGEEGTPNN